MLICVCSTKITVLSADLVSSCTKYDFSSWQIGKNDKRKGKEDTHGNNTGKTGKSERIPSVTW